MSGLVKGTVGFEPVGIAPYRLNFAEDPRYAPVAGSIPSMVATAGSIVPAVPNGPPHVEQLALGADRKLEMSDFPTTFELPRIKLRNSVR